HDSGTIGSILSPRLWGRSKFLGLAEPSPWNLPERGSVQSAPGRSAVEQGDPSGRRRMIESQQSPLLRNGGRGSSRSFIGRCPRSFSPRLRGMETPLHILRSFPHPFWSPLFVHPSTTDRRD